MDGLRKMLMQIREDISNRTLIDRFLMLLKELRNEGQKSDFVLELARILVEADPSEAMQYAYLVFQFDRRSTAALEVVVKALRNLGRYAKAEVIQNELDRLRQAPTQKERGFDENTRSFSTEMDVVEVDGVAIKVSHQSALRKPSHLPLPPQKVQSGPASIDAAKTLLLDPKATAAPGLQFQNGVSPRADHLKTTAIPNPQKQRQKREQKQKEKPKAAVPHKIKEQRSLESDLEEGQGSLKMGSASTENTDRRWTGPDLGVLLELFDFYWRQGMLREARELIDSTEPVAADMPWWKARKAVLIKYQQFSMHQEKQNKLGAQNKHEVMSEPPLKEAPLSIKTPISSQPKVSLKDLIERKQFRKIIVLLQASEASLRKNLSEEEIDLLKVAYRELGFSSKLSSEKRRPRQRLSRVIVTKSS